MTRLLAGDIGGTKTALVLFEDSANGARRVRQQTFKSLDFPGLTPIVEAFLSEETVDAAAFGVAGPVRDGLCRTTNLPWAISADELSNACGTPRVALMNDWQIAMLGLGQVDPGRLRTLQPGRPTPSGPVAAVGVGTGLGQALLIPTPSGPVALATEGGHSDFAPTDELEERLYARLRARHGRVSVERAVSGSALPAIYRLLIETGEAREDPTVTARFEKEDAGAVIGQLGLADTDPACRATVERLVRMVGAEAGNLALKTLPTGGLYIGGGVAIKLAPLFDGPIFLEAFLDKGRMRPTLEDIPVTLVLEPELGLVGALSAARLAFGRP